jgi:predicted Zn-dependent peptidase
MFQATIGTRPDNIDRARAAMIELLEGYAAGNWIDEETVARTVNALRGRLIMRRMSRVNQAYFLGMDRLYGEPPGAGLERIRSLLEVSVDDVKRVLKEYLDPERLATVVVR